MKQTEIEYYFNTKTLEFSISPDDADCKKITTSVIFAGDTVSIVHLQKETVLMGIADVYQAAALLDIFNKTFALQINCFNYCKSTDYDNVLIICHSPRQ